MEAAQEALYVGLRTVKPGIRLNEIGRAVQKIYGNLKRLVWCANIAAMALGRNPL